MRASLRGREELVARVQQTLALPTKKEAEMVMDAVVAALEATLLNNLHTDSFTLTICACGEESRSGHTGWTSPGSPRLATQL